MNQPGKTTALMIAACIAWAITEASEKLTWQDCVQQARRQNPALQAAGKVVESKEAAYAESLNALYPSLSLGYSYSNSSAMSGPGNSGWLQGVNGNFSWPVFDLRNYANLQSAAAARDMARNSFALASAQARFRLRQAYFQALYAQEQIKLLDRISQLRKTNAQLLHLQYKSGRASQGNMLITQADWGSSQADLAQAKMNLRLAQQNLNLAMGRMANEPAEVQDDFHLPAAPGWEAIAESLPGLPQLQNDAAAIVQAQAQLQQAQAGWTPSLIANYSRGWYGQSFFPPNPQWSASLNVSWPIFADGPTYAFLAVAAAQAGVDKSIADKKNDQQQLEISLANAWAGLVNAIAQVQVQKNYRDAEKQRNDEAMIEYANGLLAFENWNQVVGSLVAYEKQYLLARLNAVLAEIAWQNSLAIPLEEP